MRCTSSQRKVSAWHICVSTHASLRLWFEYFFFYFLLIVWYDSPVFNVRCVRALDQRWHCIFPALLNLCSSGFAIANTPVFLITPAINAVDWGAWSLWAIHRRPVWQIQSAQGGLRAGDCRQRKCLVRCSKGPNVNLGVDGKIHSAQVWQGFPPATSFSHRNIL